MIKSFSFVTLTFTLLGFGVSSCLIEPIPIQNLYYKYVGFDDDKNLSQLKNEIIKIQQANDYIVTAEESLIPIKRDSLTDISILHPLHQYVHRIEQYNAQENLEEGSIIIEIEVAPTTVKNTPSFIFRRYVVGNKQQEVLLYDFGAHPMVGVKTNKSLEKKDYLAEKFAQASFK